MTTGLVASAATGILRWLTPVAPAALALLICTGLVCYVITGRPAWRQGSEGHIPEPVSSPTLHEGQTGLL